MENRLQVLYWAELVQLKVSCEYIRRYRDSLAAWVTRFAVVRTVVSVSALGTWAAFQSYPMVWGGIIAAAQVADALQNAIPFTARFRGTNALLAAPRPPDRLPDGMGRHLSGAAGRGRDRQRRHAMMKLRHDAEVKNLPSGLPVRRALFKLVKLAEADAATYFKNSDNAGTIE